MRMYISGPITGVKDYWKGFNEAADQLTDLGYDVVNPAMMADVVTGLSHKEIMDVDFLLLNMCDALVQLPGWENSFGCNQEYGYAKAMDMSIFALDDFSQGI